MKYSMILVVLFMHMTMYAQEKKSDWDVADPTGEWNWQAVNFETDEGTWMNLDVSPDGRMIVFDMLGDIYSMPFAGGSARVLRKGIPWEV